LQSIRDLEVLQENAHRFDENLIEPPEAIIRMGKFIYPKLGIQEIEGYKIKRWEDNLHLVLMNLYVAYGRSLKLRYFRSPEYYRNNHIAVENKVSFSIEKINYIFDTLQSLNYLKIFTGVRLKNQKIGWATRVELYSRLTQYFDKLKNLSFKTGFKFKKSIKLYIDKDNDPNLYVNKLERRHVRYRNRESDKRTRRILVQLEKNLDTINNLYKKSDITLNIPDKILNQQSKTLINPIFKSYIVTNKLSLLKDTYITPIKDNLSKFNRKLSKVDIPTSSLYIYIPYIPYVEHPTGILNACNYYKNQNASTPNTLRLRVEQKYLRRVFKGNYVSGGRFYGSIYQLLNKGLRSCIQIDGEETVELDYGALHLMMLYHSLGIDYQGDPYKTPSGKGRKYFKKIALITINAPNREVCVHAIKKELCKKGKLVDLKGAEKLLDAFMSLHPEISKFFYSGKWAALQYADSTLMENVLTSLTKLNIVGLPIHDSVIVQKRHKAIVTQIMVDRYNDLFKFDPIVTC
jgi:hypothetical protein